ncbi:MAG: hypothetical protein QG597_4805, partial [Actinomycetota bacterium]|nr:hypothetical protein [Actinomycetota bacterium]
MNGTAATYGELMGAARSSIAATGRHLALTALPSPEAARAVIAARSAVIAATRAQAIALFGPARIDAVTSGNPVRQRPGRSATVVRDQRSMRFLAWTMAADTIATTGTLPRPIDDRDNLLDSDDSCAPARGYRRAAQLIRAATDLLDTHRTTTEPRVVASDAGILEPLRIARMLTEPHALYARSRQAGMTAKSVNRELPLRAEAQLTQATWDLAVALPARPSWLENVPIAGTIRTDTPAHEWVDRITRLPARLRAVAAAGPVGINTMKAVAAAGLVSHYLRTLDGTAGLDNPWFCVVEQLRPWHSPVPIDPGIASDSRRLQELARSARYSPDTSPVGSLAAAATATAAAVDDLVDLATRLMPSVDRWVPAKPSPSYLVRPNAVPYIAWRPTEAPIPWPTNAASIAPPAV